MNDEEKSNRYLQWEALIEEQEKSGITQKAFCEQRGLTLSQFVYYRGKIRLKKPHDHSEVPSFASVQIQPSTLRSSSEVRVLLPNGFQCYFPCQLDISSIKRFMEALLSC